MKPADSQSDVNSLSSPTDITADDSASQIEAQKGTDSASHKRESNLTSEDSKLKSSSKRNSRKSQSSKSQGKFYIEEKVLTNFDPHKPIEQWKEVAKRKGLLKASSSKNTKLLRSGINNETQDSEKITSHEQKDNSGLTRGSNYDSHMKSDDEGPPKFGNSKNEANHLREQDISQSSVNSSVLSGQDEVYTWALESQYDNVSTIKTEEFDSSIVAEDSDHPPPSTINSENGSNESQSILKKHPKTKRIFPVKGKKLINLMRKIKGMYGPKRMEYKSLLFPSVGIFLGIFLALFFHNSFGLVIALPIKETSLFEPALTTQDWESNEDLWLNSHRLQIKNTDYNNLKPIKEFCRPLSNDSYLRNCNTFGFLIKHHETHYTPIMQNQCQDYMLETIPKIFGKENIQVEVYTVTKIPQTETSHDILIQFFKAENNECNIKPSLNDSCDLVSQYRHIWETMSYHISDKQSSFLMGLDENCMDRSYTPEPLILNYIGNTLIEKGSAYPQYIYI